MRVVRSDQDRAAAEAAFDAQCPTTPTARLALTWQLSVEAAQLGGWGDGEQRLSRPARITPLT
jgi:hypothetical protein